MYTQTNIPDIWRYNDANPTLHSPNSPFDIQFAQTRESLMDVEIYKNFLDNAIARFRHSRTYKNYKAHLMEMGMNRCQFHGNIVSTDEEHKMATIEMHHNILTIFDIALIITEHMLNVQGCITTFDLAELLRREHTLHHVCTVMLTKTAHQLVHNSNEFIVPPSMCFGNWPEFLREYRSGITRDICFKLIFYIKDVTEKGLETRESTLKLLKLRDDILAWASINEGEYLQVNN